MGAGPRGRARRAGVGAGGCLDEAAVGSPAGQLVSGGELELAQDRRDVRFDRLGRNGQVPGDLLIRVPPGDQPQHLDLARRQAGQALRRGPARGLSGASEHGFDGIWVSNHGGRNMDSAPATIRVLPEIADAVGEKATVILDSGVRRGSDIVKALALGAKAVLTGRATLYGTAVAGEAGAAKAIQVIQTEMDNTMAYTGCNRVDEISTDIFFGDREGNRLMAG